MLTYRVSYSISIWKSSRHDTPGLYNVLYEEMKDLCIEICKTFEALYTHNSCISIGKITCSAKTYMRQYKTVESSIRMQKTVRYCIWIHSSCKVLSMNTRGLLGPVYRISIKRSSEFLLWVHEDPEIFYIDTERFCVLL